MLKITPATSKAVGLEKIDVEYPTYEQIDEAVKSEDAITILRWYRNLDSPTTEAEVGIINRLCEIVKQAKKGEGE